MSSNATGKTFEIKAQYAFDAGLYVVPGVQKGDSMGVIVVSDGSEFDIPPLFLTVEAAKALADALNKTAYAVAAKINA